MSQKAKYRSSVETSYKILLTLLEEKVTLQKDLPQKIGKDYRTTLRHINNLYHHDLIALAAYKWQGQHGNSFTLTTLGLIESLAHIKRASEKQEFYELLDEVSSNYADLLPLIFGKWTFFKEKLLDLFIKQRVEKALNYWVSTWLLSPEFNYFPNPNILRLKNTESYSQKRKSAQKDTNKLTNSFSEVYAEMINKTVFFGRDLNFGETDFKTCTLLWSDKDIKEYITSQLSLLKKDLEQKLENINSFFGYFL